MVVGWPWVTWRLQAVDVESETRYGAIDGFQAAMESWTRIELEHEAHESTGKPTLLRESLVLLG